LCFGRFRDSWEDREQKGDGVLVDEQVSFVDLMVAENRWRLQTQKSRGSEEPRLRMTNSQTTKTYAVRSGTTFVEIGRILSECHERLPHGVWLPWFDREFKWSDRTARNYIHAFELVQSRKLKTVSNLDIDARSLYALAAPSTSEAARDEVFARAESGERLKYTEVQEIVTKHAEQGAEEKLPPLPTASSVTAIRPPRSARMLTAISLSRWKELSADKRHELLQPENLPKNFDARFNKQSSDGIEWAQWSWNPISGCKHACQVYCYAKDFTERHPENYPHSFEPTIYPYMLAAPGNVPVPAEAAHDTRYKNVFTCSMADLFGRWVPREWIEVVLEQERNNPQWNFLFLTKFPQRLVEFTFLPNAWLGTTVDLQCRVKNAEAAFAKLKNAGHNGVRWLSVEPMLIQGKLKGSEIVEAGLVAQVKVSKTADAAPPALRAGE
jgi:protein gp37